MKNQDHQCNERLNRPSASKAKDYELCLGKHLMEQGLPDTTSPEAAMGNRIHAALDTDEYDGLTKEEKVIANACLVDRITLLDFKWPDWRDNPPEVWSEKRLWYNKDRFSGKADYIAFRGDEAVILDYKTGRIKVDEAINNSQLKWCMALADHALRRKKLKNITVSISQPPAHHFSMYTYQRYHISSAKRRISGVLRKMDACSPRTPNLQPGNSQCRYCKAKAVCPALGRQSEALVELEDAAVLTPLLLSKVMPLLGAIEARCKAIKEEAKKVLAEGGTIDGWRLKKGPSRRKVVDNHMAYSVMADAGVSFSDILDCATFSVAKIEKLDPGWKKGIREVLDECVAVTQGADQLEQFDVMTELLKESGGGNAKSNVAGGNPDK